MNERDHQHGPPQRQPSTWSALSSRVQLTVEIQAWFYMQTTVQIRSPRGPLSSCSSSRSVSGED